MKVATWNVNSIKARREAALDWVREAAPDVLVLQEIKCKAEAFPASDFEELGYHVTAVGQPAYNGVALLSKSPQTDVVTALPGDTSDEQARYVEATVDGVRIAGLYLPNGNPVDTGKYSYKLDWMARLSVRLDALLESGAPFLLTGDFNVIPEGRDCHDPAAWADDALFRLDTRAAFRRLMHRGLTDAFRAIHPDRPRAWSFWDYQAGRWPRDEGIRIDHILLSPALADRLTDADIDRGPRGLPKASDHTPVWCRLSAEPDRPRLD